MRHERGTTIVELLAGVTLGLLVLAATAALLIAGLAAWERAGARAEAVAAAAAALDQIARDVRVAGYDPRAAGVAGIVAAGPARLELAADLDGDGAIDAGSEERVGYRRATSSASLLRVVGAQAMPILSDLTSDGFRLRYFDGDGGELDPGDPDALAAVRLVTIDLATRSGPGAPPVRAGGGARLLNR
jgi:Tfp pilus assembly protein PilW